MELDPRFKIRAPLRCEGIGRLDCAEDLESGMRMAVRWLPLEANGSAAVQACEQLPEHPTLPRIRQIGQVGASAYVAMEFPDGNLLATQIHEHLPASALIGITAQIADALATIHSQDVFHGEMSADSVLLVSKPAEKAYLWDMPLVIANRLTDRRGEERLMHQLVKSAAYLSPERARGARASAEADVYALGAIICVAGGATLPPAESTLAVVHSVAVGAWSPKVPKAVPEPLRSMLERMVDPDPKARPTAREVADLFLPPVQAHRTEPEMPAIVLPPISALPPAPLLVAPPVLHPAVPTVEKTQLDPIASQDITKPEAKFIPNEPAPTAPAPPPMVVVAPPVPAPTAPIVAPIVAATVALTDNVAVAPDLATGASLLTAEEAARMGRPSRKAPLAIAAVLAVLVMVLGALVLDLARKPAPAARRVVAQPVATRVEPLPGMESDVVALPAADESDADLLSDLTPRAKKPAAPARKRAPRAETAANATEPSSDKPPQGNDFGFLEEEQELKRPTF